MEDSRASNSSQRLARSFDTFIESPESGITSIPVFRSEKLPTSRSRYIPVSIQELVYDSKTAGVGNSTKPLDRKNELIYSSEEALRPRKERGPFKRMEFNFCQRENPEYKSLVESQYILSEDKKKKLDHKRYKSLLEASQVAKSKNPHPQAPKTGKKSPKTNQKGQKKAKS
ncbi:hypothetical protein O181_077738 [Austropuccinia psidii MF-1]|uniref:Uncharacterized protein n=1 Tax=Austropuccinia psidii MF-1 TaxID=1389203 RepID=A0A9Q3FDD1_9BASI|nr:hypothetical protein [Austropuccinia psidii MF-1]